MHTSAGIPFATDLYMPLLLMQRHPAALGAQTLAGYAYHAARLLGLVWQAAAALTFPLGVGIHPCRLCCQQVALFP